MIFDWIKSKISDVRRQYHADKNNETKAVQLEQGMHRNASYFSNSQFEGDYATACNIIKKRLEQRFPDNYHARLLAGYNPLYDYSVARSAAIDESSTAIARALRAGASIDQAVKLGSQTIGL